MVDEAVEYNPYSYDCQSDPYPIYRRLREEAPAYFNAEIGFWALSRYADVMAALKSPMVFSSAHGVSLDRSSQGDPESYMSFLAMDPPRHDRMRGLVARAFTPRRVAEMEARVVELSDRFLAEFRERGACDFIGDFAGKLPMAVISELLGVPEADRDDLRTWADLVVHREDGMTDVPPEGIDASIRLMGYFHALIKDRRKHPGEELTSALLAAEVDGERLEDGDVLAFLFLMIIAGNETTTKLLGNAMYWLWKNPEERAKVRNDPGLVPRWVEETLRYDNSTQALARTLSEDVEMHGCKMREGDKVVVLIGSANRDERVFPDPDRFDILRESTSSLAFGHGTHFCMGASLARLEGRVALDAVCRSMSDFEIDPGGMERVHSINVRGFAHLPMRFSV